MPLCSTEPLDTFAFVDELSDPIQSYGELLNLVGLPIGIERAGRYSRLEASTARFGGLSSTVV